MMPSPDRLVLERFRTMIARRFGLHYDDGKLDYLADVLRQRAESSGTSSFGSYIERLASLAAKSEDLRALVEQLTVNETFFFRNADNFRALTEQVLPERIRQMNRLKRLRILSAGCASGEEAYSLAVSVREALPDQEHWDVKIVGVDLSTAMLAKAAQARYSPWSLRATPEDVRRRYFRAEGRDFVLDPQVQAMVTFEERNLLDADSTLWRAASYDVVFCRNVIMYFTPEAMREVVQGIGLSLLPGGFLFLGHAETLRGLSQEFHLRHTHDTFYYQKRDAASVETPAPSWSTRRNARTPAELPRVVDGAASWIDAIQQASERIAQLIEEPSRGHNQEPQGADVRPPPAIRWDLGLVLEAMRQERFADALELLSALPPESHGEPDALLLRAVLLANSGRLEEAELSCARLVALDELNAGAHYVMALCREHAADAAAAIEHDRTAIYLDAGFAMPHLHLGLMARRAGDDDVARHEFSQALVLLAREDASRLLLFGGGFSRDALVALCRAELRVVGADR
jgi:chemotaxis protein methyltransferase CheR